MEAPQSTVVSFSDIESEIMGIKVSRCNSENVDSKRLYSDLITNRYDLCRLKVPAEDEFIVNKLKETGLPFFFNGSIRKYKTRIADFPDIHYTHSNLSFEMYDGTQDDLLKDMLTKTWGTYPIGYYRIPYLEGIVSKEQEIECVFRFYKKFNNNSIYPNNKIMFMKEGDNYVSIFTLNTVGNTLECNLAGVLPQYRSQGYFHDEMNFKKEYCLQNGIEFFTFGARNENAAVQKIFQHLNFQTIGNDNVFLITPFLSYSKEVPVTRTFNTYEADCAHMSQLLYNEALLVAKQLFFSPSSVSFTVSGLSSIKSSKIAEVTFSFPVINEKELLMVLNITDEGNKYAAYLNLLK